MCESNGIVKLNLRGTRFETLSSTLSKDPNSLLGQMMNPDYPMKPMQIQDGYYFFDRSPDCFKIILDYLSQGDLEEEIPKRELLKLEKEAKFFKLSKLEKEITARLLQIQTEAKMSLNEVKKDSDVIKFNVSGTIFQIARSKLAEYPDCLLTQYVKGTKEPVRDVDGNIYLDKDVETYRLIFSCIKNGENDEIHRTDLISGDINLLYAVRKEFEHLNLQDMVKSLDFYLNARFNKKTLLVLKDRTYWCAEEFTPNINDNNTLERRVINSKKALKDSNGLFYLDISDKEFVLLYTKWNNTVAYAQAYLGDKYKDDPVTLLARKLGFIKENEVVQA